MSSSDDDQPAAKRQKTYEADGPVEAEESAQTKLREAGFDPDDVHTGRSDLEKPSEVGGSWTNITPMAHFACVGDLPMCRYLHHVRGASTTTVAEEHRTTPCDDDGVFWYPMYCAVQQGRYEIVKWLFSNGARIDARVQYYRPSPLANCFKHMWLRGGLEGESAAAQAHWFILNGAFERANGRVDEDKITACVALLIQVHEHGAGEGLEDRVIRLQKRLEWFADFKSEFVQWLDDLLKADDAFNGFLLGTLQRGEYSAEALKLLCTKKLGNAEVASMFVDEAVAKGRGRLVWEKLATVDIDQSPSNITCLGSYSGVLEKIGEYVGIQKNRKKLNRLRTFRSTVSALTIDDMPRWCIPYAFREDDSSRA